MAVVAVRRVITFVLVCFSWLFFRANNMGEAVTLLKALFTDFGGFSDTFKLMGLDTVAILTTLLSIFILYVIDNLHKYEETEDGGAVLIGKGAFIYFIWIVLIAWAVLLSKDMASSFIYFQF